MTTLPYPDQADLAGAQLEDIENDDGSLLYEQRVCLVELLRSHYISAADNPDVWQTLSRYPTLIRGRLNDLFIDLFVDSARGIAYKVQIRSEGRPFPVLLRNEAWTREATILLMYLRRRYNSDLAAGADLVYVDREDLIDSLDSYHPANPPDAVNDAKRSTAAIKKLRDARILLKASDDETRFRVSAVIEPVLSMDKLRELERWFIERNRPGATCADAADDNGEEQVA